MNDYEMIKLAATRGHDFRREADQARLARSLSQRPTSPPATPGRSAAPRSTLRLTLHHLFSRVVA